VTHHQGAIKERPGRRTKKELPNRIDSYIRFPAHYECTLDLVDDKLRFEPGTTRSIKNRYCIRIRIQTEPWP